MSKHPILNSPDFLHIKLGKTNTEHPQLHKTCLYLKIDDDLIDIASLADRSYVLKYPLKGKGAVVNLYISSA